MTLLYLASSGLLSWVFSEAFSAPVEMAINFCLWFYLWVVLHLSICMWWTILASME
jgi:hypothetical protein